MFRRISLLAVVLVFVSGEAAFAGRFFFRHRRPCCPPPCSKAICCELRSAGECYCIQDRIFDVPDSNFDWYEVQYYPDGCGDDDTVEHYTDYMNLDSTAIGTLPETCAGNNCVGQDGARLAQVSGYGDAWPGAVLNNQTNAKKVLQDGFTRAGISAGTYSVEFLKIPKHKLVGIVNDDVYAVIARNPRHATAPVSGPSPAGAPYFGLQMDKTAESFETLTNANSLHATTGSTSGPKVIRVIYNHGAERRVAVIWLK
jgi:hypothetical protein